MALTSDPSCHIISFSQPTADIETSNTNIPLSKLNTTRSIPALKHTSAGQTSQPKGYQLTNSVEFEIRPLQTNQSPPSLHLHMPPTAETHDATLQSTDHYNTRQHIDKDLQTSLIDLYLKALTPSDKIEQTNAMDDVVINSSGCFSDPNFENIGLLQRQSPDLIDIIQYLETEILPDDSKQARTILYESNKMLLDKNGVLYRHSLPKKNRTKVVFVHTNQLVIPQCMRAQLFDLFHNRLGHIGINKMYDLISKKYFFPRLYDNVVRFVQSCTICTQASPRRGNHFISTPTMPYKTTGLWSRMNIDICLAPIATESKNTYILVCICAASKYVFLYPLKTMIASEIADKLYDMMSFTGIVGGFMSDNAWNFLSKTMQCPCRLLGIKRFTSTSYRGQSNGQAETICKRVTATLRRVMESQEEWDKCISHLQFVFRSTINKTTNLSPHHIIFGYPTAFAILLQQPEECDETLFTTEYMNRFRQHLETLRTVARENIQDQNVKIVDAYDGAKKKAAYKHPIGSPVFVNINIVPKGQQFKYRKINLMVPMYIEKQLANNTYIIRSDDNSKLIKKPVHGDHLVKYNGYLRDPLFKMPNDDTDIVKFIQNECVDRVDGRGVMTLAIMSIIRWLHNLLSVQSTSQQPIQSPFLTHRQHRYIIPLITPTPVGQQDDEQTTSTKSVKIHTSTVTPSKIDDRPWIADDHLDDVKMIKGKRYFKVVYEDLAFQPEWIFETDITPYLKKMFYIKQSQATIPRRGRPRKH